MQPKRGGRHGAHAGVEAPDRCILLFSFYRRLWRSVVADGMITKGHIIQTLDLKDVLHAFHRARQR